MIDTTKLDCAECGHSIEKHVHVSPHPCRQALSDISLPIGEERLCPCFGFVWQEGAVPLPQSEPSWRPPRAYYTDSLELVTLHTVMNSYPLLRGEAAQLSEDLLLALAKYDQVDHEVGAG